MFLNISNKVFSVLSVRLVTCGIPNFFVVLLSKEFKRVVAISALASIELFTFFNGSIHSPATKPFVI